MGVQENQLAVKAEMKVCHVPHFRKLIQQRPMHDFFAIRHHPARRKNHVMQYIALCNLLCTLPCVLLILYDTT